MQHRTVKVTVRLPMDFNDDWNDEMINFYLNESSWCWSNIIELLQQYSDSKPNGGCICDICEGRVVPL